MTIWSSQPPSTAGPTQSFLAIRTCCRSVASEACRSSAPKRFATRFGGLITLSSVKRQLRLNGFGRARIILAALAPDLVALAQCGESVADRHFAGLVAL